MDKFSIAIVGLGGVAEAHLRAIDELSNVRLVAVCDVRPQAAESAAARYGAKAYTDYQELLAHPGLSLVMVLTPASTHRAIVEATARAGIHVFCEKPMATSEDDCRAMVEKCALAKVSLFYGSCYRYLPAVRKARELIQSGTIGRVQLMTEQVVGGDGIAKYTELAPIHYPIGGPGGPGMGLVDHGIHLIDIFSWLTDSQVVKAHGTGLISGQKPHSEFMAMDFANGALGLLTYNSATFSLNLPNEGMFSGGKGWLADGSISEVGAWESEPGSICIYGTTGSLRAFHYTNALYLNYGTGPRRIELTGRPAFGHFTTQLEDCIAAIRENRAPTISGTDGLRALQTLLQIYRQDTAGETNAFYD